VKDHGSRLQVCLRLFTANRTAPFLGLLPPIPQAGSSAATARFHVSLEPGRLLDPASLLSAAPHR
jgi:hypothetical protein